MNRLNRYVLLPLSFALTAVTAVVTLGEPIEQPMLAEPTVIEIESAQAALVLTEVEDADAAAVPLKHRAAHMRWLVTLPSARKSSCCAAPALR